MMKSVLWFLLGCVLALFAVIALADGKVLTEQEAAPTCLYYSQGYARIADLRDQGMERADLHAMVTSAVGEGTITEEEGSNWHYAIDYVFKYPKVNAMTMAEIVYKACMKDFTQRSI